MKDIINGKVAIKLGDHINADQMAPPGYMWERNPEVLARVSLANYDQEFPQRVAPGDIIIAGQNFGHGHLHMGGLIGFQRLGISAVIAESIAPGWYRGAIADGFPVITCSDITKKVSVGDELKVNFKTGHIKNLTTGEAISAEPIPLILREIINAGGMAAYVERND